MIWAPTKTNVLWAFAGVLGLLLFSTGVIYTLPLANPDQDYTELKNRIKSWWVIVAIFAISLLNRTVALVFFAFISFLALKEYLSLVPTRRVDRQVLLWGYLAIAVQYFWIYIN